MVCNNNKEWTTTVSHNMDNSQKNYAKQKNPDIKNYILYDSICIKF